MARLIDDQYSQVEDTIRRLVHDSRFTSELGKEIRKQGGAERAILAMQQEFFPSTRSKVPEQGGHPYRGDFPAETPANANPFAQTVEEQIAALRRANEEEGWGIPDETLARLAETAPAWPRGRDSYRSFRIRFGEGDEGVAKTFEAHAARIRRTFGYKFPRWEYLRSDKKYLRLLAGNAAHKPVIEWTVIHLDANRKRGSVEAVRGPKSLADEGLVLAWLFPKRVEAIDYNEWCAWFLAGYELHVPESGVSWRSVPCVDRSLDTGEAHLSASWCSHGHSGYSVPVSGK